ncbi:UNVERIFIED_ORG: alkylated DNA repair dioxygenase AlkB [Rhizobium etli]
MPELSNGVRHLPEYFDRSRQEALVEVIRAVVAEAPLFVPVMPGTGDGQGARLSLPADASCHRQALA